MPHAALEVQVALEQGCARWRIAMAHGPSEVAWKKAHQELLESPTWDNLAFDGIQGSGPGGELYESRRCPDCGSTISRPVTIARASRLMGRQAQVSSESLDAIASAMEPKQLPPTSLTPTVRPRPSRRPSRGAAAEPEQNRRVA